MSMTTLDRTFPRPQRFKRKDDPPGYALNNRKISILRALARDRFLTSEQLAEIDGGSHQNTLRLLRVLYDNNLIERPAAQRYELARHENRPLVYSLTHAGARILAELDGASMRQYNWTTKAKARTAKTIVHAIHTADVMHAFEKSASTRGFALKEQHELLSDFPDATRAAARGTSPFSLRVAIPQSGAEPHPLSVVPDRLFTITAAKRFAFALEQDQGTMPVFRWRNRKKRLLNFDDTSIARKLVTYDAAWQQDLHLSRWGFRQFRVLFVTTKRKRIDEMLDAVDFVTGGKGTRFFAFTDLTTLLANDPLGSIWTNGKRETTALLDWRNAFPPHSL
jgi:protein involved in plasmid replication-relaxation